MTPAAWKTTGSDGKEDRHWGFDQSHGALELLSCQGEDCSKKITTLSLLSDWFFLLDLDLNGEHVIWVTQETSESPLVLHGNKWSIEINGVIGVVDFVMIPVTVDENNNVLIDPPWDTVISAFQSGEPFEATIRILEPFEEE